MLIVTNISLSHRAAPAFSREKQAFKAETGEVFALLWVSNYTNADGTTVDGFEPGYMCGPLYSEGLAWPWLRAELSDGSHFYFMPRFAWMNDREYVIDMQGELFSIGPAEPDVC